MLGYTGNVGPNTTYPSVLAVHLCAVVGDELPENVKRPPTA